MGNSRLQSQQQHGIRPDSQAAKQPTARRLKKRNCATADQPDSWPSKPVFRDCPLQRGFFFQSPCCLVFCLVPFAGSTFLCTRNTQDQFSWAQALVVRFNSSDASGCVVERLQGLCGFQCATFDMFVNELNKNQQIICAYRFISRKMMPWKTQILLRHHGSQLRT